MSQKVWTAVERYFASSLNVEDESTADVREANSRAGLPDIAVGPNQARFLCLVATILGAKNVLEIGTLGGYSALSLAKAVAPDGQVVSVEVSAEFVTVARQNLRASPVGHLVQIIEGDAKIAMNNILAEDRGPFDLIFVDADAERYLEYLEIGLRLSRPGTVILFDNVVRYGDIINSGSRDGRTKGIRALVESVGNDRRVEACGIQTVSAKGHDGMLIMRVLLGDSRSLAAGYDSSDGPQI